MQELRWRALLYVSVIRYLITDGSAVRNEKRWLSHIALWMERGVEFVQIREREMDARRLAELTRKVVALPHGPAARILVNDRADVAMAAGADGVHLRDGSVFPALFARNGFVVSVACHDLLSVDLAEGADLILLAPVFAPISKPAGRPALGLNCLRRAVERTGIPVLALGGITAENQQACLDAGAAGIAGISFFC